jgi:hypothetical protein
VYKLLAILAVGTVSIFTCSGSSLYFQGFETDTSGWFPDTGVGSPDGTITQVSNGGGTLGLTAPDGTHYAEVTNSPDSYLPGYGTGGASFFGYATNPVPYPGTAFTQSMDVYVDTSLTMGPGVQDAFWIDDSPSSTDPFDVTNNGGLGFGAEHNYRLDYLGGSVAITVDGESVPLFTVATSGWYDFEFEYSQSDGTPTDISNTTMIIATIGGTVLGTEVEVNNADGETLQNQYLGGPGYMWLPVWADGFSGDTLGIDDVQAFPDVSTPEPASFMLFGLGLGALGLVARRKV